MTIVYISRVAIIIEPNWMKVKEVKIKLGKLKKKKIMIVNIHDLTRQFINNELVHINKLKELINNPCRLDYLKIFHGCTKEDFDGMLLAFSLNERHDLMYINGDLEKRKISDCYYSYLFKDFSLATTVSNDEKLKNQEL